MNKNPHHARLARARNRKRGDLEALLAEAWTGVEAAAAGLAQAVTTQEIGAMVHALASMAGTYGRLLQVGEHEARLSVVEQRLEELTHAVG
jgi:hypothetical protein